MDGAPLSGEAIARLKVVAARCRQARDDADAAILALETLIGLGEQRLPPAPVVPIRPDDRGLASARAAVDGFRAAAVKYLEAGGRPPYWANWCYRLAGALDSITDASSSEEGK